MPNYEEMKQKQADKSLHPKTKFTAYARALRKRGTKGEAMLWSILKKRQIHGYKFRRQEVFYNRYIVDFICYDLHLVIEIDGYTHFAKGEYDKIRQQFIEAKNFHVLRFSEREVETDLHNVASSIEHWIRRKLLEDFQSL